MGVVLSFFLRAIGVVIGIPIVVMLVLAIFAKPQFDVLMNFVARVWDRVGS